MSNEKACKNSSEGEGEGRTWLYLLAGIAALLISAALFLNAAYNVPVCSFEATGTGSMQSSSGLSDAAVNCNVDSVTIRGRAYCKDVPAFLSRGD